MKRYTIYSLVVFACLLLLGACTDEYEEKRGDIAEGIPVELKLSFSSLVADKIETRANAVDDEDKVYNLYVILFDENGERVSGEFFDGLNDKSATSVTMKTTTGFRYIYGIANIQTDLLSITQEALDEVSDRKKLEKISLELSQNGIDKTTRYLMSGFIPDKENEGMPALCGVTPDGIVNDGGSTKILLKKLLSKITFKFSVETSSNATSFIPRSWKVVNVPKKSSLYEPGIASKNSSDYFEVLKKDFDKTNQSFSFYMMENLQEAEKIVDGDEDKKIEKRESADYAPDYGTYLVVTGDYKGKAKKYNEEGELTNSSSEVDAYVTYYIHLGYVEARNGADKASDYYSLRNCEYTYNVSVAGVNSIVVEVVKKEESHRSGGDVYYTDGSNVLYMDAHYATTVLKFTKENVGDITKMKIMVNDNHTDFVWKDINDNSTLDKSKKWISFVENTMEGNLDKAVRYPGSTSGKLLDVYRFMEKIKKHDFTSRPELYFTCYVNEYYPQGDNVDDWKSYINTKDRMVQILSKVRSGFDSNLIDAAYVIRQKPICSIYNVENVESAWGIEWENETGVKIFDKTKVGFGSYNNGRSNMLKLLTIGGAWYKSDYTTWSPEQLLQYQTDIENSNYAACMQRNRDENGNGKIEKSEVKWYLPAITQYTDMWIGMDVLPQDARLYSLNDYNDTLSYDNKKEWKRKFYVSNTKGTNQVRFLWSEEGGSTGDGGNQGIIDLLYSIRCVRNLGEDALKNENNGDWYPTDYVEREGNVFTLSNIDKNALRSLSTQYELPHHDERDPMSRPYLAFEMAKKDIVNDSVNWRSIDLSVFNWYTVNINIDVSTTTSPCASYKEDGKTGWRLPNMRELTIMAYKSNELVSNDKNHYISRTFYSMFRMDGSLVPSKDDRTRIGYGFADNNIYLLRPSAKGIMSGIDSQSRDTGRIRCVRDIQ